jgi:hypothetical protein
LRNKTGSGLKVPGITLAGYNMAITAGDLSGEPDSSAKLTISS